VLLGAVSHAQSSVEGLESVLVEIEARYPNSVSGDDLYRAALLGVATHLGEQFGVKGNQVLTLAEHQAEKQWMQGWRQGIGAEFSIIPGRGMMLTQVFPESPAAHAGLIRGDLLVSMDNHPFTGLPAPAILQRARQQQMDEAVFDLRRTDGSIHRVQVTRGTYQLPTVLSHQEGNALEIRVPFFGIDSADELESAIADWDGLAIVLDLRDNDGGSLKEMVEAADLFLDAGTEIVRVSNGSEGESTWVGQTAPVWSGQLVVMINRGTGGEAEAFVAAMQDHGRAQVVGTRSAGRGLLVNYYNTGHDFVLKIADAQLKSPSGQAWHGTGLVPDVFVEGQQLSIPIPSRPMPPDLQRDAAIKLLTFE